MIDTEQLVPVIALISESLYAELAQYTPRLVVACHDETSGVDVDAIERVMTANGWRWIHLAAGTLIADGLQERGDR